MLAAVASTFTGIAGDGTSRRLDVLSDSSEPKIYGAGEGGCAGRM